MKMKRKLVKNKRVEKLVKKVRVLWKRKPIKFIRPPHNLTCEFSPSLYYFHQRIKETSKDAVNDSRAPSTVLSTH